MSMVCFAPRGVYRAALCLSGLLLAGSAAGQSDEPIPISLDADSSSFDRRNDTVTFQGVRITQGRLGIQAESAVATGLDFEDSEWRFQGNVQINIDSARAYSDFADLTFKSHQLLTAILQGEPAEFEDLSTDTGDLVRGQARVFTYDISEGTIRMSEDAWLREGPNEIRGCDLIYDVDQEKITASSSDCGERVMMTIVPSSSADRQENGEDSE